MIMGPSGASSNARCDIIATGKKLASCYEFSCVNVNVYHMLVCVTIRRARLRSLVNVETGEELLSSLPKKCMLGMQIANI